MSDTPPRIKHYTPHMVGHLWHQFVYLVHMITITTTFRFGQGIFLRQIVRGTGWGA